MAGAHRWRHLENPLVSLYMLTSAPRFFQQAENVTIREQLLQETGGGGGGGGGGHGEDGLDGVTSDFLRGH